MSAWIVSKGHVDALVQALAVEGLIPFDQKTKVGQAMWDENYASINARYQESDKAPRYEFEGIEAPLHDAIIVRQAGCFDYQSCEHGGWEGSESKRLLDALVTKLEARNGGPEFDYAFEKAVGRRLPWGIDHISEAAASTWAAESAV